jgi:tartrate dehydratase beta subunit/fumarate hydratase class I family protein
MAVFCGLPTCKSVHKQTVSEIKNLAVGDVLALNGSCFVAARQIIVICRRNPSFFH